MPRLALNRMRKLIGVAVMLAALLLLLTFASGFAFATSGLESTSQALINDALIKPKTARELFVIPKLFNFDSFQKLFNKSYPSALEKLARAKLYLGRAFRAFISKIGYKHGKSSSYLGINHMSDWTPKEVRSTVIDPVLFLDSNEIELGVGSSGATLNDDTGTPMDELADDETPVADLVSIKRTLEEVVENREIEPAYGDIAEELLNGGGSSGEPDEPSELLDDGGSPYEGRIALMNSIPEAESKRIVAKKSRNFLSRMMNKQLHPSEGETKPKVEPPLVNKDEIFIDYRDCLLEPRSQDECGACYSFSTISLYEWAYCKATGHKAAFSEQYPMDCVADKKGMNGCTSGYPIFVRKFSLKNGLQLLDKYPYRGRDQQCQYDSSMPLIQRSFVRIQDEGVEFLKLNNIEEKLKTSPVVMAILVELGTFQEYSGGVDMGAGCRGKHVGGHGMLLVGSGREDGQDYWLLRNSFGPHWGQKGHYKLNKLSNCIIDNHGLVVKFPETPTIKLVQQS